MNRDYWGVCAIGLFVNEVSVESAAVLCQSAGLSLVILASTARYYVLRHGEVASAPPQSH